MGFSLANYNIVPSSRQPGLYLFYIIASWLYNNIIMYYKCSLNILVDIRSASLVSFESATL